jgi:hypothetical protein
MTASRLSNDRVGSNGEGLAASKRRILNALERM